MIQLSDRPIMHEETCVCGARVTLRMPHGNTYTTQERLLDGRIAAWRDAHEVCRERDTWSPPMLPEPLISAGGYSVSGVSISSPVFYDPGCIDAEEDHCECFYSEEVESIDGDAKAGVCCHCTLVNREVTDGAS